MVAGRDGREFARMLRSKAAVRG